MASCSGGSGNSGPAPFGAPQLTQIQYETRREIGVGANATAIAAGDISGDGLADLVVTRYQESKVTYFRSLGNANYAPGIDLPFGPLNPFAIAMADLDGDGLIDVAVTDYANNRIYTYRNTGGAFAPPTFVATENGPIALAIADLNNDGIQDLAAGCLIAGSFAFHKGLGSMTYDTMVAIGIGGMPVQIALADLDGDGRIDVMCTDTANSELRLYQNLPGLPNPGFSLGLWPTDDTGPLPLGLAVANLDSDPNPEIVTGSTGTNDLIVWKTTGATLTKHYVVSGPTPCGAIALGDFDGDGKLDLAAAHYFACGATVWPGIGDATFALPVTRPTGLSPVFLAAADTTGDGLADLQVADSQSGEVCLFLGQTTTDGNVVAGPAGIYSAVRNEFFAVGDLDGDGRADIVAADDTGDAVRVLRNDGSLRFTPMATLHVPADNTNEPVLIDLDNDGDLDIIQLHTSGYSIFRNGGNFTFDLITSQNVNGGLLMGLALDLFKNGLPDLLASSYGAGTLSCYQNKQGALSLVMSLKSGAGTAGMAVGDYDLDGDLDLASVNFNESTLTITGRVGQHFAQEYKVFATEDQPTYVRAADVNRDGRPDLIVSHLTGPDILTYIAAHGPLDFDAPTSTITNGRPVAMVTPDVDLNGVPDVVYCQFETGRTSIRLIQEDAAYGPVVSTFPSQYAITSILYVDMDGDGLADVVTVSSHGSLVNIQRNKSQ